MTRKPRKQKRTRKPAPEPRKKPTAPSSASSRPSVVRPRASSRPSVVRSRPSSTRSSPKPKPKPKPKRRRPVPPPQPKRRRPASSTEARELWQREADRHHRRKPKPKPKPKPRRKPRPKAKPQRRPARPRRKPVGLSLDRAHDLLLEHGDRLAGELPGRTGAAWQRGRLAVVELGLDLDLVGFDLPDGVQTGRQLWRFLTQVQAARLALPGRPPFYLSVELRFERRERDELNRERYRRHRLRKREGQPRDLDRITTHDRRATRSLVLIPLLTAYTWGRAYLAKHEGARVKHVVLRYSWRPVTGLRREQPQDKR